MNAQKLASESEWSDLKLMSLVHEGPRTTVHRALRERDGLHVILKVLKAEFDGEVHRARLRREYAMAATIDGAAAVKPLAITTYQGRLALVLEDFGGTSLDIALHAPVPLDVLLPIAVKIARALAIVHARGIVHKDIKPSNLLLGPPHNSVKITDFGIAAAARSGRLESAAALEGSLAYLAPEQTGRLARSIDHRADLYALGVTFFELATGQRPFRGRDALEWTHCHLARVAPAASDVLPTVPRGLSQIIQKLLHKAPDERYQSATGVQRDLERCVREWQSTGDIVPFALATSDSSSEFVVSQRMYGREREIAALREGFARVVASRASEIVLISGASGIGKSSLVRELNHDIAARGFFVSGKFEQYRRHVPYSAFAQTAKELLRQASSVDAPTLAAWRVGLERALAGNGQVIADVVPELTLLLGRQPEVAALGPSETRHRFRFAARSFLRAFAQFGPVVLFWDDLQWADEGSLDLLEALFADSLGPVLCLLAFRDHEVSAAHPSSNTFLHLREGTTPLSTVHVAPLAPEHVRAIVADTLRQPPARCADVVALVMQKTEGNPFFVTEFLTVLYAEGLLTRDARSGAWTCELEAIEALRMNRNVLDLMLYRLRKLPERARDLLCMGACIGTSFELDDLAAALGASPAQVALDLEPSIEAGFVLAQVEAEGRVHARFRHDRVQQAAYSLVDVAERRNLHLGIGRRLWSRLDGDLASARLFDVANHLDVAFDAIVDAGERERLLGLEMAAGRRAKSVNAYALACKYFARAQQILADSGWAARFDETFAACVELAECRYLAGELEAARALFAEAEERSQNAMQKAQIYYLQIRLLQVAGDFASAAALSRRSFELFGLAPPRDPAGAARAVEEEHAEAARLLGDRPIAERLTDPLMTDPAMRVLANLLEASGPPIYMVEPALFPWVALKLVNISLRYGNAEASCYGYGIYALLKAAVMGDVDGGYALSQLAIDLNEKLGAVQLAGCMLHLLGDHVNFWKNPIASDLPILERGFAACVRGGDHIYSNYIGFQAPWHLYESGAPLDQMWRLTQKYESFAIETQYAPVRSTLRFEQQFIRALQGQTRSPTSFSDEAFDERQLFQELVASRFGCGVVYHHIMKLVLCFTFGDYPSALLAARLAESELGSAFSMPIYVTFTLYDALTAAALSHASEGEVRSAHLDTLRRHHVTMTSWAGRCPENFADKAALLAAEIAVAEGNASLAMRLYEQARLLARAQGFAQYEALACERAASVYEGVGVHSAALALISDAHALYRGWGAAGKADQLRFTHPDMVMAVAKAADRTTSTSATSTTDATARQLDVLSVIKAAQSISAEMVLPRLLDRLMAIVSEYAGAERGALVLVEGRAVTIAARAGDPRAGSSLGRDAPWAEQVPEAIIEHVGRTGAHVLLDDAKQHNPFSSDPYFASGPHRSVLCQPIAWQGKLVGFFYLENSLMAGAFGAERLIILEVLASQTAISIENSRLYAASQAAVLARDEFLSIASHELKTPLTPLTLHIQSLLGLIRKGTLRTAPEERLLKLASTCDGQLTRLTRLVEALLDVSRMSAGSFALVRTMVDWGELVREVIALHAEDIAASGCAIELDAPLGILGRWDRARLGQVVSKLLLNALKFGAGRPVAVTAGQSVDRAFLRITDRGDGVRPEHHSRIFLRFDRIQSRTNVDGIGLGLFIVRALVNAHGGQVGVDSRPGEGATFNVDLPLDAMRAPGDA